MTTAATFPAPFAGPWGVGSGILRNESDRCKVVPFPATGARPRRVPAQAWKLAAAVVLLLGGGLLFRLANPGAPPLPAPEV